MAEGTNEPARCPQAGKLAQEAEGRNRLPRVHRIVRTFRQAARARWWVAGPAERGPAPRDSNPGPATNFHGPKTSVLGPLLLAILAPPPGNPSTVKHGDHPETQGKIYHTSYHTTQLFSRGVCFGNGVEIVTEGSSPPFARSDAVKRQSVVHTRRPGPGGRADRAICARPPRTGRGGVGRDRGADPYNGFAENSPRPKDSHRPGSGSARTWGSPSVP